MNKDTMSLALFNSVISDIFVNKRIVDKIYNTVAKLLFNLLGFVRDPYIGGLAICRETPIKKNGQH